MKMNKKVMTLLVATAFTSTILSGCTSKGNSTSTSAPSTSNTTSESASETATTGEIKTFTSFVAVAGTELPDDNRLMNKIAEKIGAKTQMTWLTGQTAAEKIGVMIAGGEYPDFLGGADATPQLIDAGAYIPLEGYLDKYPNLKNYLSENDWNRVKKEDGHIYIIPQFGIMQGKDTQTQQSGEAFWIQKRVLEWAGYPKVKTVDEYFDLINKYIEANPTTEDGQKNIGFEILSDDWRYFCLENPPQFLAGYPNDGCAVVDPSTKQVKVYDTIPEAKQYYQKLSEQYAKGIVDPEAFTLSYDQYTAKISSGRVLGMVDQYWDFQNAENSLKSQGLDDRTYVPLGITMEKDTVDQYFSPRTLDVSNGIGITTSCKDVEGALKFMNDLLDPEIQVMTGWGEKDVDYQVGDDGLYLRTEEQRANAKDTDYVNKNFCSYSYFPHYEGMLPDGKNAILPGEQPKEFYATLTDIDKKILDTYGYQKWTDFLTPVKENSPWFPLWSATNQWTADSDYGIAKQKMSDVKHEWLPKVIMAGPDKFEASWDEYMKVYNKEVNVKAYEDQLTKEVAQRIQVAEGTK